MSTSFPAAIDGPDASNFTRPLVLHGGTSQQLIVGGEKQSDFDALLNSLLEDHQPDTAQSRFFVEDVAIARWFLWRRQRAHCAIESALYANNPDETNWTAEQTRTLAFAERYRTQAERGLKRALSLLEAWEKAKRRDADRENREAQWEANYALRERRVALQEQKFELAKNKEAAKALRFAKNAISSPRTGKTTAEYTEVSVESLAGNVIGSNARPDENLNLFAPGQSRR